MRLYRRRSQKLFFSVNSIKICVYSCPTEFFENFLCETSEKVFFNAFKKGFSETSVQYMAPRLLEKYKKEIIPELIRLFKYKNSLQAPSIKKIVVNMGVGQATLDIKILEQAISELALITGQRPIITRAKKSIANFKIRKDAPIGCKVTLRGYRCFEFLDRLTNVALPRIRDFRGIPQDSFDKDGNYSFGINEQTIFPEIEYDKVQRVQGMDITIVANARSKEEAYELLRLFGMPFQTTLQKDSEKNSEKVFLK